MKRMLLVMGVLVLALSAVGAQTSVDLSALGDDFEALMGGLGDDLLPNLEQAALLSHGPGVASLGESSFYFSMSLGALLSNGILGVINDPDAFELLDVQQLVESALTATGSTSAADTIQTIQTFFPYPVLRAAAGFAAGPVEVGFDVAGFPQGLTDVATGLAGRITGAEITGVVLSAFHLGAKVRVPLIEAGGPLPELSVGAGYSLSNFDMGYSLATIDPVPLESFGTLTLGGDLGVATSIHSFGLDLALSKRLGFFVPFVALSPYMQLARYRGGVDGFSAVLADEDPGTGDLTYTGDDPVAEISDRDVSILATGGFELFLGRTVIFVHGSYTIGEGSPGVALGTRFQL